VGNSWGHKQWDKVQLVGHQLNKETKFQWGSKRSLGSCKIILHNERSPSSEDDQFKDVLRELGRNLEIPKSQKKERDKFCEDACRELENIIARSEGDPNDENTIGQPDQDKLGVISW
jgi:hypothetical protein